MVVLQTTHFEETLQVSSLFGFLSVPPDFEETHKSAGHVTFSKFYVCLFF